MATLLLLDDDPRFRAFVAHSLSAHRVLQAGRAADARKLLARQSFDLLVVDGLLPDATGPAFLREHRRAGGREPALLVSAFWRSSLEGMAREAGAEAALSKPMTERALARTAERLLALNALPVSEVSRSESRETMTTRPDEAAANVAQSAADSLSAAARSGAVLVAQDELGRMRERYAVELPGLVGELSIALEQLRARPEQPGLFGVARRRAHQIAGLAGSFGFGAIGDACAAIEQALLSLQRGAETAWAEIDRVLSLLAVHSRAA